MAQALLNPASTVNKEHLAPTRLTHRRRSEGRGNDFAAKPILLPRRQKICEVCGAEGVKNRYCRSCAVEVSRENLSRAAVTGHSRSKSSKVKARISKAISDHAVANTWWDPSSLPAWLTMESYDQQIQPQLRTMKVREIAQAIQVSPPYAAQIRSGRRRPHPRHWEALSMLANIQAKGGGLS